MRLHVTVIRIGLGAAAACAVLGGSAAAFANADPGLRPTLEPPRSAAPSIPRLARPDRSQPKKHPVASAHASTPPVVPETAPVPVLTGTEITPMPAPTPRRTPPPLPAAVGTTTPPAAPTTRSVSTHTCDPGLPDEPAAAVTLVTLVNNERGAHGLRALAWDPRLSASACAHNTQMALHNQMSHLLPQEAQLGDRISSTGVNWTYCAENIGMASSFTNLGSSSRVTVLNKMMMDEGPGGGHYQNLLSGMATHVGVSVVWDAVHKMVWMTEDFAGE